MEKTLCALTLALATSLSGCGVKPEKKCLVNGYDVIIREDGEGRKIMLQYSFDKPKIGCKLLAVDYDKDGRFDKQTLIEVPKDHPLERLSMNDINDIYQKAMKGE